jgi:hypothetical protein
MYEIGSGASAGPAVREHWLEGVSVVRLLVRGQEGRQPAEANDGTHNI